MKKILSTLMILAAFTTANAAVSDATQLIINARLDIVDGLKLNRSGDIDFGDVAILNGETESDPITLTVTRSTTDSMEEIKVSIPRTIQLTGTKTSKTISAYPIFEDASGVVESGTDFEKTIQAAIGETDVTADIKVKMPLNGYETADEYAGTFSVTATII